MRNIDLSEAVVTENTTEIDLSCDVVEATPTTTDEVMGHTFKRADVSNYMQNGAIVFDDKDCERFIPVIIAKLPVALGGGRWEGKLFEPTGDQRDSYFTEVGNRMKRDKAGNPLGMSSSKGIMEHLLAPCLISDSNGKAMAKSNLSLLPSHMTAVLFEACRIMGGIGEDKEAEEKAGEN